MVDLPLLKIAVSWADSSQYMEQLKMFKTTNQLNIIKHSIHPAWSVLFQQERTVSWQLGTLWGAQT